MTRPDTSLPGSPAGSSAPRLTVKNNWRWILWIVGLTLAWHALQSQDWSEVWHLLAGLGPLALLTLIGINLLILPLMTARWWVLLKILGAAVGLLEACAYRLAASAISYLTPGPHFGGEPLSIYLLHHRHKISLASSATSVVVDRLLELLASFIVLTLCLLAPFITGGNPLAEVQGLIIVISMLAVFICILAALFSGGRPLSRTVFLCNRIYGRYFPARSCNIGSFEDIVIQGEALTATLFHKHRAQFLLANLCSLCHWLAVFAEFWLMSYFLGLVLSFWQLTSVVAVARLSFFTPLPAGIGVLESALPWLTGGMGLGNALGLSLCLIIRCRDLLFSLAGLWLTMKYLTYREKITIVNNQSGR